MADNERKDRLINFRRAAKKIRANRKNQTARELTRDLTAHLAADDNSNPQEFARFLGTVAERHYEVYGTDHEKKED